MKKIIIFVVIIIVIILLWAIITHPNEDELKENIITNNVITNTISNNEITNNTNNIIAPEQNGIIEEVIPNVIIETQNTSDEETAINIAKEDWGADSTVYFSIEEANENGEYIIGVYDVATTRNLIRYTVNIETKEFTKR